MPGYVFDTIIVGVVLLIWIKLVAYLERGKGKEPGRFFS